MATKFSCPSCGAEVPFKSSISIFAVCEYCQSMLVRRDMDLENFGKMAQVPKDMSPIQLGTSGSFHGTRFELIGMTRLQWSGGHWNEWYASFDDGRMGWLAEAQGAFAVSFETPSNRIPDSADVKININFTLDNKMVYSVSDIKEAKCVASRGELPYLGASGRERLSVDLIGPSKESFSFFACFDYSADGKKLYLGENLDFDNLKLENLKEIDGW